MAWAIRSPCGLSPWITYAADQLADWGTTGNSAGNFVSQTMHGVYTAIGYVADVVQIVKASFYGWHSVLDEVYSYALSGIDKIIKGLKQIIDWVPGFKNAIGETDFFKNCVRGDA